MKPAARRTRRSRALLAGMALAALGAGRAAADPAAPTSTEEIEDLMDLSLEELMDLDVTIVSRSRRKFSDLPAAVYVITGDEIRRAGHSSIPEALRMVPGIHVSRWTMNAWDVTSRGYGTGLSLTNLAYLNQLLVMVDGVVVYTPLFAGVWWPLQDMDLRDVDRIEVVRGPAGVLWGSNAVHGIVHVITKDSADTQGFRAYARNGTDDRHFSARMGGMSGDNTSFRVWGKFAEYDTLDNPFLGIDSKSDLGSAGFRADWRPDPTKHVTIWGRGYDGLYDDIAYDLTTFEPYLDASDKDGYQLFASLEDSEDSSRWQAWWTRDRQDYVTFADIRIETFDLEYQRQFSLSETNVLSAGLGVRAIESRLRGDDPFYLDFDPMHFSQVNPRAFVVDRLGFPEAGFELDVGFQIEDNEFVGVQVQPTVRASWRPREDLTLWAGVTNAVRTPSLEERTLSDDSLFVGNDDFQAEDVISTELGFRKTLGPKAVIDLALFHNDYDDLSFEQPLPSGQFLLTNGAHGESVGGELSIDLRPTERWQIRTAYSYIYDDFDESGTSNDVGGGYSPNHLFNLRSYYQLGEDWELDAGLYVVDGLDPAFDVAEYVRADLRLGWHASDEVDVAIGVQDVGSPTRSEFDEFDNSRRAFYFSVTFEPGRD